jgi:hypothetical protein
MGSRHLSSRPFGTRSFALVPGSELPGYSRMSLLDVTKMSKLQCREDPRGPSEGDNQNYREHEDEERAGSALATYGCTLPRDGRQKRFEFARGG